MRELRHSHQRQGTFYAFKVRKKKSPKATIGCLVAGGTKHTDC
jgi:hypothetical protein